MAQYKVIQDIEAEDKLLGPFSLRQFIYAGGATLMLYLSFIAVTKGAPFMLGVFLPPALFCAFFAWPWSQQQPTEVWALARIRYFFKPRRRIWDQSGAKDLVTITAPKRPPKVYTNGLSQGEVRSRLAALADTIDSRGWAIKNVNVNMATLPTVDTSSSDRLVNASMMPQQVSDIDIAPSDDMLDEQNNPIAAQFDHLITQAAATHRQQLIQQLQAPTPPAPAVGQPTLSQPPLANAAAATANQSSIPPVPDYWFLHQQNGSAPTTEAGNVVFANTQVVAPGGQLKYGRLPQGASPQDEAMAKEVLKNTAPTQLYQVETKHMKKVKTPEEIQAEEAAQTRAAAEAAAAAAAKAQEESAILGLAYNDDLDVATIARQAKKMQEPEPDEVVIELHK